MMRGLAISFRAQERETSCVACTQKSQQNETRNHARSHAASNFLRGTKFAHAWRSALFEVRAMRMFVRGACLESATRGSANQQSRPQVACKCIGISCVVMLANPVTQWLRVWRNMPLTLPMICCLLEGVVGGHQFAKNAKVGGVVSSNGGRVHEGAQKPLR